jgi:hypothetical protein
MNPGIFTLSWADPFLKIPVSYEYIDGEDMKGLDLSVEVDPFFLVKWGELSYAECTW